MLRKSFSQSQAFSQKFPVSLKLEESPCWLNGVVLNSGKRPFVNIWLVPINLSGSKLASSVPAHKPRPVHKSPFSHLIPLQL